MPLVEARAFDDESRPTALALTFAPYAAGMTRVMDGITSKLGWGRLNLNVGPGAGRREAIMGDRGSRVGRALLHGGERGGA